MEGKSLGRSQLSIVILLRRLTIALLNAEYLLNWPITKCDWFSSIHMYPYGANYMWTCWDPTPNGQTFTWHYYVMSLYILYIIFCLTLRWLYFTCFLISPKTIARVTTNSFELVRCSCPKIFFTINLSMTSLTDHLCEKNCLSVGPFGLLFVLSILLFNISWLLPLFTSYLLTKPSHKIIII